MAFNEPLTLDGSRHPTRDFAAVHDGAQQPAEPVGSIASAIARWAKAAGHSAALVSPGVKDVTFSELLGSIESFAARLAQAGIAREDRVGLLVPAGVEGAQLVVALATNVALFPINPSLTDHEMIELVNASSLKAVVIPQWLESPARSALPQLQQPIAVLEAVRGRNGVLDLDLPPGALEAPARCRPARDTDIALLLRSSGTTGAPKLIPVTHLNLLAMARKMGSDLWYRLGPGDRAACTSPLYYAAGLKTSLFVPLMLGASVGCPPAGHTFDIAQWLDALKPTYLSVAPGPLNGMVDRLRDSGVEAGGGSLRFVMCGSAYLPEELRVAAQDLLRVPVLEFYGLSEAGVMAANPAPPGRNKPGTVGLPAPAELRVVNEKFEPVANGAIGQIVVGGPSVTPGYAMTQPHGADEFNDGWLATGDLGRLDEDGYLSIVGRMKEVINRGGEKVFPYEVEKAILEHPAVLEAAAFGVPHARLGEIVGAAAVLRPGMTVSQEELRTFLGQRLASFKLPRRLQLVTRLPRGSTGKVLRRALSQTHETPRGELARPQQWLEFELLDLWERLLGTDELGIDDDFFEKGGDSLLATEMLVEVERLAGNPYPQSELSTLTIRRMAEVIAAGLSAERDLITQVKRGSGIPLFFCHGDYVARGLYAQKLAALLPDDRPVFLLHCYPDSFIGSTIEEIAGTYLPEVVRLAAGSPVIVGGYCNGGLAAWHLAHLLQARGVEVLDLLLIETLSLNGRPALRALSRILAAASSIAPGRVKRFLREDLMRAVWILARTGAAAFTAALYRAARNRLARKRHRESEDALQPSPDVHRAFNMYYRRMAGYVLPRLDTTVTCFVAEETPAFDTDPAYWRRFAKAVRSVSTPGDHHTVLISERPKLALALGEALRRASAGRLSPPVPDEFRTSHQGHADSLGP